jgi:DNA-binding GntR family transcriptional regulator
MSVADQIYENLKKSIISAELDPGHRLFEVKVAESYQVSRTPVREAFRRLEQDFLVQRVAQGGVKVAEVDPESVEDLFGIRTVLEEYGMKLACERITPEQIAALREIKAQAFQALELYHSKEVSREYTLKRFFELNSLFHESIYEATGSRYLVNLFNNIRGIVMGMRSISIRVEEESIHTWQEHSRLIDLLEQRNKKEAVRLIKKHIARSASQVIAVLRKESGKAASDQRISDPTCLDESDEDRNRPGGQDNGSGRRA